MTHIKPSANMEFIPGYGYRWADGSLVYQEQQLIPGTVLPIGHDYGKPWAFDKAELHIKSMSDGFWLMDRLGSYHRHPFQTVKSAEEYLRKLNESGD